MNKIFKTALLKSVVDLKRKTHLGSAILLYSSAKQFIKKK